MNEQAKPLESSSQKQARNCKSVMKGFVRRQDIFAIYGGNFSMFRRERDSQAYNSVKGRNKLLHSKSISDNQGDTDVSKRQQNSIEYESDAYDTRAADEAKNKSMFEVMMEKKASDMQLKLLTNRINMLDLAEQKAVKKLDLAKKRAEEIQKIK